MIKEIYNELEKEFKNKIDYTLFEDFCYKYIIETINDSEILKELNKKNKDISKVKIIDYFENDKILLKAIKVLTLLEISKDFKNFQKLNKLLKSDKNNSIVEFDKELKKLLDIKKE